MQTHPRLLPSLLALAAASLFGTVAAHAQTVSPVPAPTIITSAPYTINASGYYQLGANLDVNLTSGNIILINAPNVVLDFAGHYISGPTPTPATTTLVGVYASERANLVIQNGTISHCQAGVLLNGNGTTSTANVNGIVRNMTIKNCTTYGVYLIGSINGNVTQNRITNIGGASTNNGGGNAFGVFVAGTNVGNFVSDNTIASVLASTDSFGWGIFGDFPNYSAINNDISKVASITNSFYGTGIEAAIFALNNRVSGAANGLMNCAKYKDNLTNGATTPFSGGTAVGTNN